MPTGNFGDIFAGYVAKRMGLPIEQLVIASNANDILPRTLETGATRCATCVATSSPSMDIQISSNFERYLFEASGRDAAVCAARWLARRSRGGSSSARRRRRCGGISRPPAPSEAEVADAIRA